MSAINIENLKTLKYHIFKKILSLSIACGKCGAMNVKKYLKKKNQLKY